MAKLNTYCTHLLRNFNERARYILEEEEREEGRNEEPGEFQKYLEALEGVEVRPGRMLEESSEEGSERSVGATYQHRRVFPAIVHVVTKKDRMSIEGLRKQREKVRNIREEGYIFEAHFVSALNGEGVPGLVKSLVKKHMMQT